MGGAINAYKVHNIMRGDDPAVRTRGAVGGFVMGAVVFGLPLWGAYALITHFL
jgi:hypothetical protein